MATYKRFLNFDPLLEHRSIFLLGPRQTGKTTFLNDRYPNARYFDLLDAATFRELSARPELMRQSLHPNQRLVVIDEIQKLPQILDEVHRLIEQRQDLRFVLTGSSARKLRRGGANLLAGRALIATLHPLVSIEVDFQNLDRRLLYGSLPMILDSPIPHEDLRAYVGTYLQEEIQAEGLTRNIEGFSRFLEIAALTNGQQLNFTKIGSDAAIPPRTVQNYYQVLEDTLIGHIVHPYRKTKTRKSVSASKFYFFDVGVVHALLGQSQLSPKTKSYGVALEHLTFLELRAYLDYQRLTHPLCYWRSHSRHEVDFVIGDDVAIEVKSKERVTDKDLKGLRALAEEIPFRRKLVLANETWPRVTDDGIEIVPIPAFFESLWAGDVIG